jgi:hypothetical protein
MDAEKTTVTEKETVTEPADEPAETVVTVEIPKDDEDEDE